MSEALGVIASIIELVGFAKSVAASLYGLAKKSSTLKADIKPFADHIDASATLFLRLREALEEDAKAGRPMKDLFREDILRCTKNCENVLRQIQEAASGAQEELLTDNGPTVLLKHSVLYDRVRLNQLRSELSESQTILQLMLTIHWRPSRESQTRTISQILSEDLQSLRQSQIPGVAKVVDEFIRDVSKLIDEHKGSQQVPGTPPITELQHAIATLATRTSVPPE